MPDYWKDVPLTEQTDYSYYRVNKRTMKVMSTKLSCPPVLKDDVVPHAVWSFWIPAYIWEEWKQQVQRDLRPQDFIQARSEYDV